MKRLPEGKRACTATILSISPIEEDHWVLRQIVDRLESTREGKRKWMLLSAPELRSALAVLRERDIPIVISERNLLPDTWKEVLAALNTLPKPPVLIVSARCADDYLWAEALNFGVHDVLTKPFHAEEVLRVLNSAWFRCENSLGLDADPAATLGVLMPA